MNDEKEKEELLKKLQEASNGEDLNNAELEAIDGGLLDNRCVNNRVPQCGCHIQQDKREN